MRILSSNRDFRFYRLFTTINPFQKSCTDSGHMFFHLEEVIGVIEILILQKEEMEYLSKLSCEGSMER